MFKQEECVPLYCWVKCALDVCSQGTDSSVPAVGGGQTTNTSKRARLMPDRQAVFFSCSRIECEQDAPLTADRRYSVRVSPQMANRIVDSARSILNKFIPDIYIYTDHMKGVSSGKSPGFGLSLVAETTTGAFLSAELASNPQGQGAAVLPEDLGQNCAKLLLEEIYRGGCVDSTNQSLGLLLMTLGQQDVSKVLLGPLSPYTIEFLRHLKSFFQIMFKIETKPCGEELKGGDKVLLTCVGVGFSNLSKTLK
ncbi:RNA 3'-terminal phosphate cyclase-like protein isoform X4 [Panthera leo]|uniref:RNA 3'-terminal phosphate cyclase-like protein isoform X4 n=2 Tax=Panthera TaxID=9688 RepID=UPI001C69F408|nr:RNA 3'-terminal phosphate cyclase-like protein isoform X4 [Panthera leo]